MFVPKWDDVSFVWCYRRIVGEVKITGVIKCKSIKGEETDKMYLGGDSEFKVFSICVHLFMYMCKYVYIHGFMLYMHPYVCVCVHIQHKYTCLWILLCVFTCTNNVYACLNAYGTYKGHDTRKWNS